MRTTIYSLFFFCGLTGTTLQAQMDHDAAQNYNKWSIGLQFGGHEATIPTQSKTSFFSHLNGDVRYMLNNRFGLMADIGYDNFKWKNINVNNSHLIRFSIQGVANIGDVLSFSTWTQRIGLLGHAGVGYSQMWQKDAFAFNNADKMGSFIWGITPQIKLNRRLSFFFDWSNIIHVRQNRMFDFSGKNAIIGNQNGNGVNGFHMTTSIGINIYLGKRKEHADWTPSERSTSVSEWYDDSKITERLDDLEQQLLDDDNDGVINARDLDNNTPSGAIVNSKGIEINVPKDSDNDGIIDEYDRCPKVKGTFSNDGCPIINSNDSSQNGSFHGTTPNYDNSVSLDPILFDSRDATIRKKYHSRLMQIVNTLRDNPEYKLEVHGHTDQYGDESNNYELSQKRSSNVKAFLMEKGIQGERISTFAHGEAHLKIKSDSGSWKNRRVEFKIVR